MVENLCLIISACCSRSVCYILHEIKYFYYAIVAIVLVVLQAGDSLLYCSRMCMTWPIVYGITGSRPSVIFYITGRQERVDCVLSDYRSTSSFTGRWQSTLLQPHVYEMTDRRWYNMQPTSCYIIYNRPSGESRLCPIWL